MGRPSGPGRRGGRRGGPPDILYHATTEPRLADLGAGASLEMEGGKDVYFSTREGHAWQVAHRFHDTPAVLYVDVSRAIKGGCRFERNRHGLWQAKAVPSKHILNLRPGFAHQASAGGFPVWFGPSGPEGALSRGRRRVGATWAGAKGKRAAGESPTQTAIREIQEEMGCPMELSVEEELGFVRYAFTIPDGSPRLKTLHMYILRTPERRMDFHPPDRESIEDVAWFTPEEAVRVISHRSLQPLVRKVRSYLVGK